MLSRHTVHSTALGGPLDYLVWIPDGPGPFPVLYLLHGRGDSADSWEPILDDVTGLDPRILVIPDAPWSDRASYWVDSLSPGGHAVETAIVRDLVVHVDESYPTDSGRAARSIAGCSMGGSGALRLGLAHPDVFGTVVALSPAVYLPEPPIGSSARESGAFGTPGAVFDPDRYRELAYPDLLARFPAGRPIRLVIAAGENEQPHPGAPVDLSIARQAAELAARARRVPGIDVRFTLYPGGHDFGVWSRALREALGPVD